jgi:FlaA1/EpsC-like NDP-sugar epimerase
MWLLQRMGERLARPVGLMQRAFRQSPPAFRRAAAMLVDAAIVIESFAVALLFRFNGHVPSEFWSTFWVFAVFASLAFVLLLYESGVYQSILRYTGIYQGVRVASATSIATGGLFIADFGVGEILGLRPVPLSVILVGALLAYMQLVAVRLLPRVFSTS